MLCQVAGRTPLGPYRRPALDQKFAEPVSLSSTALADFPLPGTVLEFGFDLLGFRARRKRQSRGSARAVQEVRKRRVRNLRKFNFPHFHSSECSLWKSPNPGETVDSPYAPPSPTLDRVRRDGVHLGPALGRFHLGRVARRRRLGRDLVHRRSRLGGRDLPLRTGLRRRRAAPSGRPSGTSALSQRVEQPACQVGADPLA